PSYANGTLAVQRCQSYLFFGPASWALVQVAPKSIEISTCFTVRSPAQAAPRTLISRVPGGCLVPFAGLVTIARTGIDSRSRKALPSSLLPGTIGLTGTRYDVPPMPWPSCGLSRTQIRVSHFDDTDPGQPAITRRTGKPCTCGSGSPLMAQTMRL